MVKNSRIALVAITILAIGVLILPQTVSLFAGQHYWYNISSSENDIPCGKCHADVKEELGMSNFHVSFGSGTGGEADQKDCEACHRGNSSITYASSGTGTTHEPGKQAHAASIVACMMCHQNNSDSATSYAGYYAGGFNVTDMDVSSGYNYSNGTYHGHLEAHNAFVAKAINNQTLKDSNEACIACHTFTPVKINWSHARTLEFKVDLSTADITTDHGPHNWTITEWSTNQTAYATVYGDTWGTNASTSYNSSTWPGEVPGVNYTYSSD